MYCKPSGIEQQFIPARTTTRLLPNSHGIINITRNVILNQLATTYRNSGVLGNYIFSVFFFSDFCEMHHVCFVPRNSDLWMT